MQSNIFPVIGAAAIIALIYNASPVIGGWLVVLLVLGAIVYHDKLAASWLMPQIQSV